MARGHCRLSLGILRLSFTNSWRCNLQDFSSYLVCQLAKRDRFHEGDPVKQIQAPPGFCVAVLTIFLGFGQAQSPENLAATAQIVDGTSALLPGTNGVVRSDDSNGRLVGTQPTSSSGSVGFTGIAAGSERYYKVCDDGQNQSPQSVSGEEHWGQDTEITITNGHTANETCIRNMPYGNPSNAFSNSDNQEITRGSVVVNSKGMSARCDLSWITASFSNEPHILTAVARDAAGNTKTSLPLAFTVSNPITDLWMYRDALESPWIMTGSGSVTLQSTEQVHTGTYSEKIICAAWNQPSWHSGNWGNTQWLNPDNYTSWDFYVFVSGPSGNEIIYTLAGNDSTAVDFPPPPFIQTPVPRNTWTLVSTPMSSFGFGGRLLSGLAIQVGSAVTLYIDDMRLVGKAGSTPPSPPSLSSPSDGATEVATSPTLSWNASSGATSYRLQVSTSAGFATTVFDQSGITGTSKNISGLVNNTLYYWRVNATNAGGTSNWSEVRSFTTARGSTFVNRLGKAFPAIYYLGQNFPNPCNPSTSIQFSLPQAGYASLVIYNTLGTTVRTLLSQSLTPGTYRVQWDARDVPTGVYFYRLMSGMFVETRKMLVIR